MLATERRSDEATKPLDPRTPASWLVACAQAEHLLDLVAARDFGLINAERCEDIITRATELGYRPVEVRP